MALGSTPVRRLLVRHHANDPQGAPPCPYSHASQDPLTRGRRLCYKSAPTRQPRAHRPAARMGALPERHALDPPALHRHRLERDLEPGHLRMRGEPCPRARPHATRLLRVDHLERMPETVPALLLHLG